MLTENPPVPGNFLPELGMRLKDMAGLQHKFICDHTTHCQQALKDLKRFIESFHQ